MVTDYDDKEINLMKLSAQARDKSRVRELVRFAQLSGYKKLGVANCLSMEKYAKKLADILRQEGFEVFQINCKASGLRGCDISPELKGASCDPVFQANYLNEKETDFNISFGLCLVHGLLFQKHSKAAVTVMAVKDPESGHKIIDTLK